MLVVNRPQPKTLMEQRYELICKAFNPENKFKEQITHAEKAVCFGVNSLLSGNTAYLQPFVNALHTIGYKITIAYFDFDRRTLDWLKKKYTNLFCCLISKTLK